MLIFPTPPTVMPSVGDGTGASVVQVPCAYPDCAAVKVASAPAAMARSHFRRAQERSNMFLPPLGIHERQSEGMRAFPCAANRGEALGSRRFYTRAVRSFAPFGLAAFPAARTAQAPTSVRRGDADRGLGGSGRAQSLCPAGPGLCGGEPPVRVPAFVRGAGPFLHTSLNGSCPGRKLGRMAGRYNQARAETQVGEALKLA